MPNKLLRRGARWLQNIATSPARYLLGSITHVSTQESVAALTFDDGPHPEYTPRLIDLLARYNAHGTFFMVGKSASQSPDLVRRMATAGHSIGNHSWDHPCFPAICSHERREQIAACDKAIAPYGERIFRPPYGAQSVASRLDALRLGHRVIAWNVDAGDWWDPNPERIAERLAQRLRPGCIAVFHDSLFDGGKPSNGAVLAQQANVSRDAMLMALELFLRRCGRDWSFITVPQLIRRGRPHHENWYVVPKAPARG